MEQSPGATSDKVRLRAEMRAELAALKPLKRAMEEEIVNARIMADEDWTDAETVLVYKAVRHELSVVSATNHAFRVGKRVCFPRVASGALSLHEVTGWDELQPGAYNIPEPAEASPVVSPAVVDIALVPGLAFDASGRRLGQGGGFYDRLLPTLGGVSWGVGFACQEKPVPTEPHDRRVDQVIFPGL